MNDMMEVISELCSRNDITVTELERILNFSKSSMLRWKHSTPSVDKVKAVADYFDVSVDYIIGRTKIQETAEKALADKDIVKIQRLRFNLNKKQNKKMMDMIRLQFEEDFPEEEDNDDRKK